MNDFGCAHRYHLFNSAKRVPAARHTRIPSGRLFATSLTMRFGIASHISSPHHRNGRRAVGPAAARLHACGPPTATRPPNQPPSRLSRPRPRPRPPRRRPRLPRPSRPRPPRPSQPTHARPSRLPATRLADKPAAAPAKPAETGGRVTEGTFADARSSTRSWRPTPRRAGSTRSSSAAWCGRAARWRAQGRPRRVWPPPRTGSRTPSTSEGRQVPRRQGAVRRGCQVHLRADPRHRGHPATSSQVVRRAGPHDAAAHDDDLGPRG